MSAVAVITQTGEAKTQPNWGDLRSRVYWQRMSSIYWPSPRATANNGFGRTYKKCAEPKRFMDVTILTDSHFGLRIDAIIHDVVSQITSHIDSLYLVDSIDGV